MGTGVSKPSPEHTSCSAASLDSGLGANSATSQLYQPSEPLQGREEIGRKTSCDHTFGEDSYFSDIASDPSLTMALRPSTPSRYARSFSKNKALQEELKESKHPELKPVFLSFEEVKDVLALNKNKTERLFGWLNKLVQDKILSPFEKFADEERREVMGNRLANIGFVKVAVDYYNFVLEEQSISGVTTGLFIEEKETQNPGLTLVLKLREVFWNFSDGSCNYSEKLAETKLLHLLVGDLEEMLLDDIDQLEHDENILPFSSAVGIIHNCARNKDIDGDVFRDIDTIGKLHPFLKSSDVYVQMVTLLALGNLINFDDSSQVCLLHTGKDVVKFVFDAIQDALASEDRRAHGFTVSELVDGLASLAQSDSNKAKIMSLSPLEMIKQILRRNEERDDHYSQYNSEVVSEKLAAVRLVWELAFLNGNKQIISADEAVVDLVQVLKLHSDPELRLVACGAWFIIVEKDKARQEILKIEQPVASRESLTLLCSRQQPRQQHIMISYQWADQKTILKINDFLERNSFNTWVDVKFMHQYGNVLEGMAKAVEGASMVLICFSEKYKKSQNCRTEAEFVFVCKKPFVCLKMQQGYTADGWLGALLGAKLFIEFSGKYKFEDKLAELLARLRDVETLDPDNPVPQPPPPRPAIVITLENWKKYDVEHWASRNNMSGRLFNKVRSLTGPQLAFLYNVYKQAPETFYRWTETKLKLDALEDIMRFTKAIEELGQFM